jgi:hypothetical protein
VVPSSCQSLIIFGRDAFSPSRRAKKTDEYDGSMGHGKERKILSRDPISIDTADVGGRTKTGGNAMEIGSG